ncbi:MAG: adenosylcobinamide-GDP ribazoletransferase [Rhodospirillaceae bacterium]|nr:adenosylcobinamide-GDP ribazoletransferase [Rhodospirillaceae bacterium]
MPEERTTSAAFQPTGWWEDFKTAITFLTRLPIGIGGSGDLVRASRFFPLAGAVVGVIAAIVYMIAIDFGLTALLAGALAIGAGVLVTGALHEDGLADFADGLGVRGGPDARLVGMRDSHLGVFGALALMLGLLLRVGALAALAEPGEVVPALIAAHAGSRALLPWIMHREAPARVDGLAVAAGRPGGSAGAIALGLGAVILLLTEGLLAAFVAALLAAILALLLAGLARRRLGGVTGDVLGAIEQTAEVAILLALVASR